MSIIQSTNTDFTQDDTYGVFIINSLLIQECLPKQLIIECQTSQVK